ncbi:hypothetical protein HO173_007325 [Letharia columbiana]|uniref:Uncharacterized protein n=1 Tax=Letharia columbiana TaxID=112416 RepID=A0A8H6FU32_9LECA|nr:uncharacterized protein HO173_007325 [Letharia columbiana]KAF6234699.1 hypothetical protein HO173_007325 [Letharia columbiana]
MPPSSRTRRFKADSVKESADPLYKSDDEQAHPRPIIRKSKGSTSKRNNPQQPVSEANISTEAPIIKADNSRSPEPLSYLFGYITKQVGKKYEKPVRDEFHKDLKAIGEGRRDAHPGHAGAMDRSLQEVARLKLQAGLETVQPAIAEEVKPLEDLVISEYTIRYWKKRLATIKRDNKRSAQRKQMKFTRAEVAEAHEMWVAKRTALGLPLDGDLDDLAPAEHKHNDGKSVTTTRLVQPETNATPDSDTSAEEQPNESGTDDSTDSDSDPESSEEAVSEFSFTADGIESSESGA